MSQVTETDDMMAVPGGTFLMGSDDFYPEERPVRPETIASFLMDRTPVTNAQFSRFVAETNHVTFAEIAPDPRDYPGMDPALALPGSIVFIPPKKAMRLSDGPSWWHFIIGADWRHPSGPGSTIEGLEDHPVVHVGFTDALAYAAWAGKQLPSEAEWERAARGGLEGVAYAWGDQFMPRGKRMAKTWIGAFPHGNKARPGLERTAPVGSYPANGFGLSDLIGNVWEWTESIASARGESGCCAGLPAATSGAPQERILKGGSHMCAPEYCQRYRPAARWLQPVDTTTSHVGFRCIRRLDA
jgi:formylglycine-generating enzyme required for sulfatase activity